MKEQRIAIIRIKGKPGLNKQIKDTFNMLKLYKKHTCVVIPNTPAYIGMLTKVKDAATWGEINEKTFLLLFQKRGRTPGNKELDETYMKDKAKKTFEAFVKDFMAFKAELKDIPGLKLFFKLSPPRGGFERKGIKVPYAQGGVCGYRKDKINELIEKMI